jgi:diaminohydroxyphosphoribosylaminopyrimidine deaminase/5-amino-6-(5-phosphoribosylamino)uracil reductase
MLPDEQFMQRCLQLARLGNGAVAPNPMVGAVLVYQNSIIGEGYHQEYGGPHAEVSCLQRVNGTLRQHIPGSVLYVSLEPCVHHGKTPPCTDLILREKIPDVVVGCTDTFSAVAGKGIEKLRQAGVNVITGVLEEACRAINRPFFTFHEQRRPYIILKWAQTADRFMAHKDGTPLKISNIYTDRLVHKWRSENTAIMIGAGTAIMDDPALTNRLWSGRSPVRILLDPSLRVPSVSRLFDKTAPVIVFNKIKDEQVQHITRIRYDEQQPVLPQLLSRLYEQNIQSVLVEGGAVLLQSFIDSGCWDEARVITAGFPAGDGLAAPVLRHAMQAGSSAHTGDRVDIWNRIPAC